MSLIFLSSCLSKKILKIKSFLNKMFQSDLPPICSPSHQLNMKFTQLDRCSMPLQLCYLTCFLFSYCSTLCLLKKSLLPSLLMFSLEFILCAAMSVLSHFLWCLFPSPFPGHLTGSCTSNPFTAPATGFQGSKPILFLLNALTHKRHLMSVY